MKKILPVLLIILGVGGGVAAGIFLKPPERSKESDRLAADKSGRDAGKAGGGGPAKVGRTKSAGKAKGKAKPRSYVKIGRQTVVPVVQKGETRALMLFELAVDVLDGTQNRAAQMEPRLRDAFLRELFRMSHTGAFMTTFTDDRVIEELRRNLVKAGRKYLGDDLKDVLILDVMRQEL